MLSVNFKVPGGPPINTRNFNPGELVEIYGKVAGDLGFPESIPVLISIQVGAETVYDNVSSSFLGNYSSTVNMPMNAGTGNITVVAEFLFGAHETKVIPISIGNVAPPPYDTDGGGINWGMVALAAGVAVGTVLVVKNLPAIKAAPKKAISYVSQKLLPAGG